MNIQCGVIENVQIAQPETPEQHALLFPKLDNAQIAQLTAFGVPRHVTARETVFDQGSAEHGVFIVLSGSIEIVGVLNGVETVLTVVQAGEFTGEVNLLSGRRSLILCRACEASALLEIDRSNLRRVMQTDAVLGEMFLRAFVLRRVHLIENSIGDAVLIGSSHSSDTLRLRTFLARNGQPHAYLDVDLDPDTQAVLDHFSVSVTEIPVLICRGQLVLRNPSNAETASCFGLNVGIEQVGIFDESFFLYYEEVDLCRRIKAAGYAVRYWPDVVVVHLGGESSKAKQNAVRSNAGAQLTLWRLRSGYIYYRKHHGHGAWLTLAVESGWHLIRLVRNSILRSPARRAKAEESRVTMALAKQAWRETRGGRYSPPKPW